MDDDEARDRFVEKLERAPIGQQLVDVHGQRWVKDPDELWNNGGSIRQNSLAMWVCCDSAERRSASKETGRKNPTPDPVQPPEGLF